MDVIGQSGFLREKVVVFGRKWLHSGKVDVFRKSGCIREKNIVLGPKLLYSGNMVEIGQKWLYSGKSGSTRAKLFYS